MENNEDFVKSEYSLEELEQFRDENGFIDLTKAEIIFTIQSREIVGNPNRVKNWVNFKGKKVLLKGEAFLDEERNYGIYAELIVEEIAKQLGIETAHYDLVKMIDEMGNEVFGVLSESIVNVDEGEQLISLRDIIGDEPIDEGDFVDTTSYDFTIERLRENLTLDGYSQENIKKLITDYKKYLAFSITVLDVDKHTENLAFIKKKINGKDVISLSSNFDSESALMLDYDYTTVEKLLSDYYNLKESVDEAHPRIGLIKSIRDGGYGSFWKDTLEALIEDDEVFDYCNKKLLGTIDMDIVLDNVERRINAKLPENVRYLAKYAFNLRNEEMSNVIGRGFEDMPMDAEFDIDALLENIILNGLQKGIRTGEMISIGRDMEDSIMNSGKDNTEEKEKDETDI